MHVHVSGIVSVSVEIRACVVEIGHGRAVEDSIDPVHGRGKRFGVADVADRLACGFLLLGPRTAFPSHRHAAEELYVPLAGTAFWQRGRRPYAPCPPGQMLHHSPWLPHAVRTADEPLLALYVWRGDALMHAPLLG